MTFFWPDEQKAKVAVLLKEGKSAREIGTALGFSKNSIIGLVRRNSDLAAIGYASRPDRKVPPPQNERQAYDREYMRAWKAKQRGVVIPFPMKGKPKAKQVQKPELRVVSNNVPMMVQDWLEKNGGPRRFEYNATADKLAVKLYLEERGVKVNGYQGKWTLSTGRGRPRPIKWVDAIQIADEFRAKEGLEPFLFASRTNTMNGGRE